MSLITLSFALFLPLVFIINFLLPRKYRYIWLCMVSLFFYLSVDVRFALSLGGCVLTTYIAGCIVGNGSEKKRKAALALCLAANVGMLLLFRYTSIKSVFVPLGMSFYTLQAMGYVIDVYRNKTEVERNLVRYALFVSFFPTVLSGPIQRGTILLPQLRAGRDFDYRKAHSGLYFLLWGYLLKIVMADRLGTMVDFAYGDSASMPGATLLWATVLYAVQLYCDFAGYSALAIGTGKILGFDLGENFFQPYFAVSIKDFWSRWHISLSSWLRDYVYIPLGGNRKGKLRRYLNLMITFLVSGLWHGSGANFLVWGGLHGFYQVAACFTEKKEKKNSTVRRLIRGIITFILVDFAWLFFRADSVQQALDILHRIVFDFQFGKMTYYGSYLLGGSFLNLLLVLTGIAVIFMVDLIHEKKLSIERFAVSKLNIVVRWTLYIALTLLILLIAVQNYGQSASTFIYTRF